MTTNESRMLAGKLYNVYDAKMAKKRRPQTSVIGDH